MSETHWNSSKSCSHANENVCPTCDFDGYYENKYPNECPWAETEENKHE
jgi:hypothetical protein